MLSPAKIGFTVLMDTLKAAAESSRLRILLLLSNGDLTVSDITEILNQSQPRVSRHLKILMEAQLIERYQEGSWAYFRLNDHGAGGELVGLLLERASLTDVLVERDFERLRDVKNRRHAMAAEYFRQNAASWDRIRSLHIADDAVERELRRVIGDRPFQSMLDLGTGTGRLLEIFAPLYHRAVGIDLSREMLVIARANLEKAGITHAQVRLGDIYAPPVERNSFDLVTIHQVLHYLYNPQHAILEAARMLRPAGRLAVVDFAPHLHEFLRDDHAHVRLGFPDNHMQDWFEQAGLDLEESVQLDAGKGEGLTIHIWLGKDRRQLIAGGSDEHRNMETA